MNGKLSRTKLARYVVAELLAGNKLVIRELAAYLIDSRRTGEADLIIRSILEQFERERIIVAEVTTAHGIDESLRDEIKRMAGADKLELEEHIDPTVLGGIRIETPSRILDATLLGRITKLRERKI